jgi:hypothetical protein
MNLMISETAEAIAATHAEIADILSYAIGECALGRVWSPVVSMASAPF